jgi:hypothetical protein
MFLQSCLLWCHEIKVKQEGLENLTQDRQGRKSLLVESGVQGSGFGISTTLMIPPEIETGILDACVLLGSRAGTSQGDFSHASISISHPI